MNDYDVKCKILPDLGWDSEVAGILGKKALE